MIVDMNVLEFYPFQVSFKNRFYLSFLRFFFCFEFRRLSLIIPEQDDKGASHYFVPVFYFRC